MLQAGRIVLFIALCTVLCAKHVCAGESEKRVLEYDPHVLGKGTATQLEDKIGDFRKHLVTDLVGVLADRKSDMDARIAATRLLGVLRAPEAVTVLCDNISLNSILIDAKAGLMLPPCQLALVHIGKPATREILSRLHSAQSKSGDTLELFCRVVAIVEGYDIAEFIFNKELGKAKSIHAKKAFETAIRYLRENLQLRQNPKPFSVEDEEGAKKNRELQDMRQEMIERINAKERERQKERDDRPMQKSMTSGSEGKLPSEK